MNIERWGRSGFRLEVFADEIDEIMNGLYSLRNMGLGSDTMVIDRMIRQIQNLLDTQRQKRAIAPPFDTTILDAFPFTAPPPPQPHWHLTPTQQAEVRDIIRQEIKAAKFELYDKQRKMKDDVDRQTSNR